MKFIINYIEQRFLFRKQERQLIFPTSENQQLSFAKNAFSSQNVTPSFRVMRMCCCTMSH